MRVRAATVIAASVFVASAGAVWLIVSTIDQISEAIAAIDPRNI